MPKKPYIFYLKAVHLLPKSRTSFAPKPYIFSDKAQHHFTRCSTFPLQMIRIAFANAPLLFSNRTVAFPQSLRCVYAIAAVRFGNRTAAILERMPIRMETEPYNIVRQHITSLFTIMRSNEKRAPPSGSALQIYRVQSKFTARCSSR